jgi:hypothetical protein
MRPFLSYAREDKERVRDIAEILIQAGHDPWFDDALLPGQDWKQKLSQAIHECDSFIYILSPESVESEWCQWEFKEAVKQGKPIIPIMLRQTKLPRSLSKIQFVDFTGDTFSAKSVAKLMGGLTEIAVNITAQVSAPESPKGNPPQEQPPNQPTAAESNVTRWIGGIVAAIGLMLGLITAAPVLCQYGFTVVCPPPTPTPITTAITATPAPTDTPSTVATTQIIPSPSINPTFTPSSTASATVETPVTVAVETTIPVVVPTTAPASMASCGTDTVVPLGESEIVAQLLVNLWACRAYGELETNTVLKQQAESHLSYLFGIDQTQAYITQNDEDIAAQAQGVYNGAVAAAILIRSDVVTLETILAELTVRGVTDLAPYHTIGVATYYRASTDKGYLVLLLGS